MHILKSAIAALILTPLVGCDINRSSDITSAPKANQETMDELDALISQMTLAEKIGQMTQAERRHATPEDVKTYFLGSILNGGGSFPGNNTLEEWREMITDYQQAALSTRLGIPMIYGTDAVHGHNNVVGATLFPHNVGLGAMRNPQLVRQIAEATAAEVAVTGAHWNFAPALCVSRDVRWGRAYECYGEHPEIGESYAGPYVEGMQSSGQVLATAKHWVGDGGVTYGTGDYEYVMDRGDTQITLQELRDIHIAPYIPAFSHDVGSVMYSYSSFNGLKMHAHEALNNDLLKDELGFSGFVVSDWQAIEEIDGETNRERVVKSINAGLDMAMEPEFWREYIRDLTAAVEAGEVSMQRIDDAVKRILKQKKVLGLFERPLPDDRMAADGQVLGHADHRAIARQAVRESQVLLKNSGVLPLSADAKVFVAGSHAHDVGLQSGGWSIEWQGKGGAITSGTTILEGIREHATEVTFSADGTGAQSHDVAIVVVGEQPYAEGFGDYGEQPCKHCQPLTLTEEQQQTIAKVKAANIPVVVVMISGRPLLISEQLPQWDALIAAWLPGTEGNGVADVLFGQYAPSGKLPVTWPKDLSQVTLKVGDEDYNPLFPYGFGLTY